MRKELFCLPLAACLALTGCGRGEAPASPSPEFALVEAAQPEVARQDFTLPADPAGDWNPYAGGKGSNMTLAPLIYESLFELEGDFSWDPLLAKEATASEDGLTWTVTLQEGVSFSNGQALDAKTALASVNAARDSKSGYAPRLAGVRSVTAGDDNTLTFTLAAPNARFPALLDFPIALVDKAGVWGTGPYVVEGDRLVARDGWWRGLSVPLAEIPLLEMPDAGALAAAFSTGQLSLAAIDPTGSDVLGYGEGSQSWPYATSNVLYLGFQCAKGPCKSPEFRRLVSQAIDREGLAAQILMGHADPATLPAPVSSGLYEANTAQALALDIDAAAQALDELGYTLGDDGLRKSGRQDLSLSLAVNSDNVYKERLAQAISEGLEQLGVTVEVKTLAWEDYKKALEKGDFDLYLAECRMTGDLDPTPFLTSGSGLHYGGFYHKELTGALGEARKTGEWQDFYDLWAQQVPLAVLCFKNAQLLTQWGQVEGADPTQGNLFYHIQNWHIN